MLAKFPAWQVVLIALTLVVGTIVCLPNLLPRQYVSWIPTGAMRLGLDLQGGASILLEVDENDLRRSKVQALSLDVRTALAQQQPAIAATREARPDELLVKILRPEQMAEALRRIQKLGEPAQGQIGARNLYEVAQRGPDTISVKVTQEAFAKLQSDAVDKSLEGVRSRVDATGMVEPNIQKQGTNRIIVEVPGLSDTGQVTQLVDVLQQAGVLTFKMVDNDETEKARSEMALPPEQQTYKLNEPYNGRRMLPSREEQPLVLVDDAIVDGTQISGASASYDQNGTPAVSFQLHPQGAKRFGDASTANVGRRFAIILDDIIISAPVIREAITGGSGQISDMDSVQASQNLALILRSGALPAKLQVVDKKVVSASLGADSIAKGVTASVVGLVLVTLFMLAAYGLLGVFAVVALVFNVILLIGAMSMFGSTLTLPGIAGILLTIGMAVDANVLVFERIREEKRNGRSPVSSVDIGYQEASGTIFDANFTHFLAGGIMFFLGSGPVKGFALTLVIGILSSYFTAVILARLIMAAWLQWFRPKHIPI